MKGNRLPLRATLPEVSVALSSTGLDERILDQCLGREPEEPDQTHDDESNHDKGRNHFPPPFYGEAARGSLFGLWALGALVDPNHNENALVEKSVEILNNSRGEAGPKVDPWRSVFVTNPDTKFVSWLEWAQRHRHLPFLFPSVPPRSK